MRRLLVAEDEELARRELETTVPWERWGYMLVGAAEDGAHAWDLIVERRAEVVVTDIRMPGMDGMDLMRKALAELEPASRPLFVILSGHADFEYAREAVRLGAFDFLIKPVDDGDLEDTMLRASRRADELERIAGLEKAAATDLAYGLLRDLTKERVADSGDAYVEAAIADLRDRFVVDLSADSVAERLGISGDHLSRLLKKATGMTFNEYLTRLRMKRAMELLRDPAVRIGEVADLSGYKDARYFSTLFHRVVGSTPSEFRHGRKPSPSEGNEGQ
ncbi:MAG: helix-turn-helix domain-containing protein [Spirochaetes bacterium]|nr:helix-turn-helix domain-containing protein [Spirochaetota bacterium]MBU1082182.1 helix-turn-helix domain-containing protein [Spirochaetota bacterium]